MTFCTQNGPSLHRRLLCGAAARPDGTAALLGVFQTIQTTCAGSVERELMEFHRGLVIPAVINLCFELKNDVKAERHKFAFVCHMSDVSTYTVHRPFYGH